MGTVSRRKGAQYQRLRPKNAANTEPYQRRQPLPSQMLTALHRRFYVLNVTKMGAAAPGLEESPRQVAEWTPLSCVFPHKREEKGRAT